MPLLERQGVAYGYSRVSHESQKQKNLSIPVQIQRIDEYFSRVLEPRDNIWGKHFADEAISASKNAFRMRPAGKAL